jgi:hypothetical protein
VNIPELGFVSETMLAASIVGQWEEVRILWHRCCSSLIIYSQISLFI